MIRKEQRDLHRSLKGAHTSYVWFWSAGTLVKDSNHARSLFGANSASRSLVAATMSLYRYMSLGGGREGGGRSPF